MFSKKRKFQNQKRKTKSEKSDQRDSKKRIKKVGKE